MKKKLLFIFLMMLANTSSFSQISEEKLKVVVLFHLANYFTWQKSSEEFTIGYYGNNPAIKNELQNVAKSKKIKGKNIIIKEIITNQDIDNINLLYVGNELNNAVPELFQISEEKGILLVTEYMNNNLYTMINFIENETDSKRLAFKVNKQNILLAKLDYKPELLLYGGTEIDIKNLYKEIQILLEGERQNVRALKQENDQIGHDILEKNELITNLEKNIQKANNVFLTLNDTIDIQKKSIQTQTDKLKEQKEEYKDMLSRYTTLTNTFEKINNNINNQKKQLSELDKIISKREQTIKEQSETITQKESRLLAERKVLHLFVLSSVAFLIIGILIFRAYRQKRKYNSILELKVDERTQELKATNEQLLTEIEERQKYEKELILSERNYREIFNATSEAIFIHDASTGAIIDVNDPMLHLYGFTREELPQIGIAEISAGIAPYTASDGEKQIKRAVKNETITFEWLSRRKNGELFWTEVSLKSTNIGGKNRVLAVVRDIDEKKKIAIELDDYRKNLEHLVEIRTEELQSTNEELEHTVTELNNVNEDLVNQRNELEITVNKLTKAQQQLIQAEKLASLGVFTAGIAHEINNPVNFISSGTSALFQIISDLETEIGEKNPNEQIMFEDIAIIQKSINLGIDRTTTIISSLRNYARSNDNQFVVYNVINCINDTLVLLHSTYKYHTVINKQLPEVLEMECIPERITQIFVNIINNASQAIEKDGIINIKAEIVNNESAIFEVSDNGCGIEKTALDKIFDPFFTTKPVGKGTGLGLYIVHGIIAEHKGSIEVNSSPNSGTNLKITLPLRQTREII